MLRALNRLKILKHQGINFFSWLVWTVFYYLSFLFLSFYQQTAENYTRVISGTANLMLTQNTHPVQLWQTVPISVFIYSTWWFMLTIWLAKRLTPWDGLPWPSYFPYSLDAMPCNFLVVYCIHNSLLSRHYLLSYSSVLTQNMPQHFMFEGIYLPLTLPVRL